MARKEGGWWRPDAIEYLPPNIQEASSPTLIELAFMGTGPTDRPLEEINCREIWKKSVYD